MHINHFDFKSINISTWIIRIHEYSKASITKQMQNVDENNFTELFIFSVMNGNKEKKTHAHEYEN